MPGYQIRRSGRAKRLRITVRPAGVEVVAPLGTRDADIFAFVRQNQSWIERKTEAIRQRLALHAGSERLAHGALIPYRGAWQRLRVMPARRARPVVRFDAGLHIELPDRLPPTTQEAAIERALVLWLRRQARLEAEASIARHRSRHGLAPSGLKIKEHKTLWGSCTAKGVVNLNWRLILAPPAVLDYVVVHELCHLRHRHHQPPFWRLVGQLMPDYQEHRRWLRANGHLLTLRAQALGEPASHG